MDIKKIWLSSPHMGGNEQYYVNKAFEGNWIAPLGPNVDGLEKDIEVYLNSNVNVAVLSSGTSAIHLALILAGVTQGDEVICQSFTFSASANPIMYLGATPVFVDSEEETWNMCPELLESAIKDRIFKGKKPKAIIVVDLYGMPAKMDELIEVANKYGIKLIEDAAEALGSKYKKRACGTLANYGVLSFNGNKIITTSGGGALICNSKEDKEKTIHLATQARDNAVHYQHSKVGYNYRMSNVVAGIGRGQMEVIDNRVEQRRFNYNYYKDNLKNIKEIFFLDEPKGVSSNRWLSCIVLPNSEIREKIRLQLLDENIESRPLWKPMHLQPVFEKYDSYLNGVAQKLFDKGLCLPSGSNMIREDRERVVKCIRKVLG